MTATPAPRTTDDLHDVLDRDTIRRALHDCCALAWEGNALAGGGVDSRYVDRIVAAATTKHGAANLPSWREHVAPALWDFTWAWARNVILRRLGGHFAAFIPLDHHELADALATLTTLDDGRATPAA